METDANLEAFKQTVREKAHDLTQDTRSSEDIRAGMAEAIRNLPRNHAWVQRGPFVVCTSCHNQHATYIGVMRMLSQDTEGQFIVIKRNF